MSKKKGLSAEEKVEKVAGWFESHPEPYTLKELQSLIPKSTGVIYQSIEECVEILVAENRLHQEKIGVQTLVWKFPLTELQKQHALAMELKTVKNSKTPAARLATMSVAALQARRRILGENLTRLNAAILQRQGEVGSPTESKSEMQQLETLTRRRARLRTELQQLAAFDPGVMDKLHAAITIAVEAANRWTENFFLLENYITSRMGQSSKELRALLCIPSEFDYIDDGVLSREKSPAMDAKKTHPSSPGVQLCAASALLLPGGRSRDSEDHPLSTAANTKPSECDRATSNQNSCSNPLPPSEIVNPPKEANETTEHKEVEVEVVMDSSTQSLEKENDLTGSSSSGGTKPSPPLRNTAKNTNGKGRNPPKEPASAALRSSPERNGAAVKSKGKETKEELPKEAGNSRAKTPLPVNGGKRASSSRAGEEKKTIKVPRVEVQQPNKHDKKK
ncbi:unnamed protein product [Phytomonas sp. EM1]|nr:unnamed protein product [Phytomonas sp. EM1]|eukprot:CCW62537.1 unnamed protein product [Phytomonas sp. isolate EM1]